jgi:type IV secretion system protein VirD4
MPALAVSTALGLTTVLATATGRVHAGNMMQAVEDRSTTFYHEGWVAAAWPVENALRLLGHQSTLLQFDVPIQGHNAPVASSPETGPIGWSDWLRPGVETRWRQLHAHTRQTAQVRQLVTLELWLTPLLILVLLAKPLLSLTAGLGRLRPGSGHGSARLATDRELRSLRARAGESGLRLGRVRHRAVALPEREVYEHVLVVGPPGSGKSSGLILPNILAERGTRSLVIVDPKSELLGLTRGAVAQHSEVWVVNFLDPVGSHGYNPLALVSDYLSAEAFAECWITNTGRSTREPFWDNASKQLIVAAVLHLRAERTGPPPTLTDLADFFTRQDAETITAVLGASQSEAARNCATSFLASMTKNEKLLGSVFAELPPRFSILQDPRVRATTGRHQVQFARLGQQDGPPVALYLALERTMAPLLKPLSACFFMQLFEELIRVADASPGGFLPRPVLGYADEFGNIGAIPDMARWMSTVRSARMGFLLAVQDLAQLGAIYGKEGRQIIVTDCSTKIALARTSADDAEWFSRGTGTATVLSYTAGDSRKRGERLPRSGSRGVSETGRPLLTPGEVTRLPEDTMLVLSSNRQPMLVRQRRWYQDRRLRQLVRLHPPEQHAAQSTMQVAPSAPFVSAAPVAPSQVTQQGAASADALSGQVPVVAPDDGAIHLDHDLPAGECTWVEAPEDGAEPAPAREPVGVAGEPAAANTFEPLLDG